MHKQFLVKKGNFMGNTYYTLLDRTITDDITTSNYRCNIHCQGAWNDNEQHMAAATGLLAYELEQFKPRSDMRIGQGRGIIE